MGQARYLLASLASKAKANIYDGEGVSDYGIHTGLAG